MTVVVCRVGGHSQGSVQTSLHSLPHRVTDQGGMEKSVDTGPVCGSEFLQYTDHLPWIDDGDPCHFHATRLAGPYFDCELVSFLLPRDSLSRGVGTLTPVPSVCTTCGFEMGLLFLCLLKRGRILSLSVCVCVCIYMHACAYVFLRLKNLFSEDKNLSAHSCCWCCLRCIFFSSFVALDVFQRVRSPFSVRGQLRDSVRKSFTTCVLHFASTSAFVANYSLP